jgi:hypothetical protein
MTNAAPPDRFDERRREWIAFHQGWSTIQRRRAEELGRIVRKRQRARTASVPDPHDDTRLDPLWIRRTKSTASQVEFVMVCLLAAMAAIGWPAGWTLKTIITRQIPQPMRGYPVAALLWSGAALGAVTVLAYLLAYDPDGSFAQIVVLPWLGVQLAAIPTTAGIYGIAEGWLAVEGSQQWWPLTPAKQPLTAEDAATILGGYEMTGPGVVDARPLNELGERTRP